MYLDLVFGGKANLFEEDADVGPLITLHLDHLSVLRVFHHCAIASKLLEKEGVGWNEWGVMGGMSGKGWDE